MPYGSFWAALRGWKHLPISPVGSWQQSEISKIALAFRSASFSAGSFPLRRSSDSCSAGCPTRIRSRMCSLPTSIAPPDLQSLVTSEDLWIEEDSAL